MRFILRFYVNIRWLKISSGPKRQKANIIEKTCSFEEHLNEACHKNFKVELKSFNDFDEDTKSKLKWRACLKDIEVESICRYHEFKFGKSLKKLSKCCDAFNIHRKRKKPHGTHNVTLKIALTLEEKNIDVVPGWKFCRNCYQKFVDSEAFTSNSDAGNDDIEGDEEVSCLHSIGCKEKADTLNESLKAGLH